MIFENFEKFFFRAHNSSFERAHRATSIGAIFSRIGAHPAELQPLKESKNAKKPVLPL